MLISFFSGLSFYLSIFLLSVYYILCFFYKKNKYKIFSLYNLNFHQIFNIIIFGLTVFSFTGLIFCFIYNDFNIYIVYANSQKDQNLLYKIGATWSSYEGSMLLWLIIMSLYGLLNALFVNSKKNLDDKTYNMICHVQSGLQLFLYFIVFFIANPFKLTKFHTINGLGFNPLLQDFSLLTHPPILFFGYASTSVLFAQIIGFYLINRSKIKNLEFYEYEKTFYKNIRIWILSSLFFLTAGIFLGSHWSYRELGWGGIWAWDPVENVSLLPWLCSIAALHLSYEQNYFSKIKSFLFGFSVSFIFILSLFATFIVRSGFVSSIHSFTQNSSRSSLFLFFIILLVLIFLFSSFIYYKPYINNKIKYSNIRKHYSMMSGSILFLLMALVIIFSICAPILFFIFLGKTINLNENFFEYSFGILLFPILFLMNISYYFAANYNNNQKKILMFQFFFPFLLAFICYKTSFHSLVFKYNKNINLLTYLNLLFAFFNFLNTILYIIKNIKIKFANKFPKILGHFSFALLIFSSICVVLFEEKNEIYLNFENNKICIKEYCAILKNLKNIENKNIVAIQSEFEVFYKNNFIGNVKPELKFYKFEEIQLSDSSSILTKFLSEIYIVTPRINVQDKSILTQIYIKPFICFFWISGILMCISFLFSILYKCKLRKK
jgi:cytochrome c-type biogenesis protein CcmF